MSKRKEKLQELLEKVEKTNFSSLSSLVNWLEKDIKNEIKNIIKNNESEGKISPEESKLNFKIQKTGALKLFTFIDKWSKGEYQPSEEELPILWGIYRESATGAEKITKLKNSEQWNKFSDEEKKELEDNLQRGKKYEQILKKLLQISDKSSSSETPPSRGKGEGNHNQEAASSLFGNQASSPSPRRTDGRAKRRGDFPWLATIILTLVGIIVVALMFISPYLKSNKNSKLSKVK